MANHILNGHFLVPHVRVPEEEPSRRSCLKACPTHLSDALDWLLLGQKRIFDEYVSSGDDQRTEKLTHRSALLQGELMALQHHIVKVLTGARIHSLMNPLDHDNDYTSRLKAMDMQIKISNKWIKITNTAKIEKRISLQTSSYHTVALYSSAPHTSTLERPYRRLVLNIQSGHPELRSSFPFPLSPTAPDRVIPLQQILHKSMHKHSLASPFENLPFNVCLPEEQQPH
jgi:hypothetical protein